MHYIALFDPSSGSHVLFADISLHLLHACPTKTQQPLIPFWTVETGRRRRNCERFSSQCERARKRRLHPCRQSKYKITNITNKKVEQVIMADQPTPPNEPHQK